MLSASERITLNNSRQLAIPHHISHLPYNRHVIPVFSLRLVHPRVSRFPRRRFFRGTTCQNSEREQHWQHQNVLFPVRLNHKTSMHRLFQVLALALRDMPAWVLPGLFSAEYMTMFSEQT